MSNPNKSVSSSDFEDEVQQNIENGYIDASLSNTNKSVSSDFEEDEVQQNIENRGTLMLAC